MFASGNSPVGPGVSFGSVALCCAKASQFGARLIGASYKQFDRKSHTRNPQFYIVIICA